MLTILDVIKKGECFLQEKSVLHPRRNVEDLLIFYLQCTRCELYMQWDKPLEKAELDPIRRGIKRLAEQEPLEYITGMQTFYQLDLAINKDVLVPRPETEILVDKIVEKIGSLDYQGKFLWDIGTGSGAIGLSLQKKFPNLFVTLSDFSHKAITLAKENARRNAIADVRFLVGDLFSPFSEEEKVDFLVSNPPYLSSLSYKKVAKTLYYEPKMALCAGETGLEFYERLERESKKHLSPSAKVFFEIGYDQADSLLKIFSDSFWKHQEIFLDWAGHPRFFFLEID